MYSIVDVETTGGKFNEEGITEIAIYKFDGNRIIDQFISLINPEIPIQPFVQQLTGINNKMLINAPKFFQVAKRILEITENTVLVAHNSSFDYRMLRIEFKRLGFDFSIPQLCTVRMSKKLIPNMKSYKLGNLVKSLGIPISNRHRASGDALATTELFKLLLIKDQNKEIVNELIKNNDSKFKNKFLNIIEDLKNITGVYYIYNKDGIIIYIGKSKNIKNRMNQHLTGLTKKSLNIQLEINSVSCEICGNELIALLKESEEIKIHKPKFNKVLKKEILKFGLELCKDSKSVYFLRVSHYVESYNYIEIFSSLKKANNRLSFINTKYNIDGQKSLKNNININNFIKDISYPYPDMIIIDKGRSSDEKSVVLIKNSKYIGFGYFSLNYQITNLSILESLINQVKENNSYDRLIINYLKKHKVEKIINTEMIK
ncbi:MAG: exonuclease domain-containing protein [Flavobacteriaceae bacterium]|nr:exonuclease domain-containing protein [Flavobacteriaceae bacterium]